MNGLFLIFVISVFYTFSAYSNECKKIEKIIKETAGFQKNNQRTEFARTQSITGKEFFQKVQPAFNQLQSNSIPNPNEVDSAAWQSLFAEWEKIEELLATTTSQEQKALFEVHRDILTAKFERLSKKTKSVYFCPDSTTCQIKAVPKIANFFQFRKSNPQLDQLADVIGLFSPEFLSTYGIKIPVLESDEKGGQFMSPNGFTLTIDDYIKSHTGSLKFETTWDSSAHLTTQTNNDKDLLTSQLLELHDQNDILQFRLNTLLNKMLTTGRPLSTLEQNEVASIQKAVAEKSDVWDSLIKKLEALNRPERITRVTSYFKDAKQKTIMVHFNTGLPMTVLCGDQDKVTGIGGLYCHRKPENSTALQTELCSKIRPFDSFDKVKKPQTPQKRNQI